MRTSLMLKEARRRAGISQAELAERLGTKQPVIARWETGVASPSMETIGRALRACGFDLDFRLIPVDPGEERSIASRLRLTPAQRLVRNAEMLRLERVIGGSGRRSEPEAVESP
jgi:transcriptional regulator with XRE-family HTH domain